MTTPSTRIVILGGGFAGVYAARTLESLLGADPAVEISLVSRDNYMVFQPMLPEVISGSIGLLDTIAPIRRLCPATNLYTRTVEGIDLAKRRVQVGQGLGSRPLALEYDHLVIALGNVTSLAGAPGLAEHALPFKYMGDALAIRNHVIDALEQADVEPDAAVRRALLTFVVAGGGFSGVEAVAELNDFVRAAATSFRHTMAREIRVVLLHAGPVILPELPTSLGTFAQTLLMRRGVEIRFNTRLTGATAGYALLAGGERIATRTLISTVPSAANPLVASLPCARDRGRIAVDPYLAVPDHPGVWAAGDCAFVLDAKTHEPAPPTAQHAVREARCLAANIAATLRGRPKRAFSFAALGKMGSLGHRSAVAEVFGVKLSGFLAWWLWRTVYLMKLPGFDRKLRVAMDWTLDLVLPPDIAQLRTGKALGVGRAHFGPDEIICREGDRGDCVYVVAEGEVAVTREGLGGATVLRTLGRGESFGEIALVRDSPRTATVKSVTPVDVLTVDREAFLALFTSLPELRQFFQRLVEQRLMPGM
jgi:NADH dehydrogenase